MTGVWLGVARPLSFSLVCFAVCALPGCLAHERDAGDSGIAPCEACDAAVTDAPAADDAGGACECPAPPPGCVYDGVPCGCSHMTCAPVHCGRAVCAAGTTCCNATCGTCVPPGGACTDIACAPDCSPQDAHSGGRCANDAGYAWDGTACRPIACRCVGTQCDTVFSTQAECDAYFSACPDCSADDATGVGACAVVIGYAFTSRGCFPISGCGCTGTDCAAVAGRTETACNDAHASCPILFL